MYIRTIDTQSQKMVLTPRKTTSHSGVSFEASISPKLEGSLPAIAKRVACTRRKEIVRLRMSFSASSVSSSNDSSASSSSPSSIVDSFSRVASEAQNITRHVRYATGNTANECRGPSEKNPACCRSPQAVMLAKAVTCAIIGTKHFTLCSLVSSSASNNETAPVTMAVKNCNMTNQNNICAKSTIAASPMYVWATPEVAWKNITDVKIARVSWMIHQEYRTMSLSGKFTM
mmetsp:Transcript_111864/g.316027  ORF Transcript_111864/g.316027 Transcript_111864/m.316027 type:complete len:230 (+) Transcript_111864:719-1408(+)